MLIHKQLSERLLSFIAMDQQMYIWMNCGTLALIHTGCSPFEWKYCLHILVYSLHCYLFPCTLFLVRWFIRALPQHTQLRDLWKGLLRIRYSLNISVLCLCFYFYLSLSLLCFFPSYLIVFSIADHIVHYPLNISVLLRYLWVDLYKKWLWSWAYFLSQLKNYAQLHNHFMQFFITWMPFPHFVLLFLFLSLINTTHLILTPHQHTYMFIFNDVWCLNISVDDGIAWIVMHILVYSLHCILCLWQYTYLIVFSCIIFSF